MSAGEGCWPSQLMKLSSVACSDQSTLGDTASERRAGFPGKLFWGAADSLQSLCSVETKYNNQKNKVLMSQVVNKLAAYHIVQVLL